MKKCDNLNIKNCSLQTYTVWNIDFFFFYKHWLGKHIASRNSRTFLIGNTYFDSVPDCSLLSNIISLHHWPDIYILSTITTYRFVAPYIGTSNGKRSQKCRGSGKPAMGRTRPDESSVSFSVVFFRVIRNNKSHVTYYSG